jgi:flavin reductase (DIM6/NTAB) family NADH-FMN oxidoreductase RutF
MDFDLSTFTREQAYYLMTQTIVPRPIAWVLSRNANETLNLAPFSFFNAVASAPPTIMISVGHKPDGSLKDTRANLIERGDFVIHIPRVAHLSAVNDSAQSLPETASELELFDLPVAEFAGFSLPRLAQCPVAMACRYAQHIEIGPDRQAVIFGEIKQLYVADEVIEILGEGQFAIDPVEIDPLARLGRRYYSRLGDIMSLARKK